MKKSIIFGTLIVGLLGFAQQKLDAYTLPTSPAASVLGMQPSVLLQPKSYRAIETALYSNFVNSSGTTTIPNDFSLEVMPYWIEDHGISLEEYLYPKTNVSQLWQNSSFSIASTQKFMLKDSIASSALGLGYRTSIYFCNNKDKEIIKEYISKHNQKASISTKVISEIELLDIETLQSKETILDAIRVPFYKQIKKNFPIITDKEVEQMLQKIYKKAETISYDSNNRDAFLVSLSEIIEQSVGYNYQEFKKYIAARQGLYLNFATGLLLNFPDNNFGYSRVPKYGIWLSPSYHFSEKTKFLKINTLFHYEHYYKDFFGNYLPSHKIYSNNFDYGLGLQARFNKLTLGIEATGRKSSTLTEAGTDSTGSILYKKDSYNDSQYIATFSYQLFDQIAIQYQIGSGFKPTLTTAGNLISLFSLNFGLGGPDKSDLEMK